MKIFNKVKIKKYEAREDMVENINALFTEADKMLHISEKRKSSTMDILRKKIEEKPLILINNKRLIMWNQLKYMDKSMLIFHALICMAVLLSMALMSRYGMEDEEIILISVMLSGFLGVISIVEISRIFSSGIAEISESCYFNVKQMVAFNMLISGIINLTLLSVEILFAGYKWKIELVRVALYILIPFIFVECCCLGVLLLEVGRKKTYLMIMVGVFAIALYLILMSDPRLYRATAFSTWLIALFVGLFILSMQIRILFSGIKKGEMICTN